MGLPSSISTADLAATLAVSDRRIQQLAKDGVIPRCFDADGKQVHGQYSYPAAVHAYIAGLKDAANTSEPELEYLELKKDGQRIKNEHDSLRLAALKNEAHSSEVVRQIFGEMVVTIRSRLQSIPHLVAPQVQGKDSIPELVQIISKAVTNVLLELKDYDAKEFQDRSKQSLLVVVDQDKQEEQEEQQQQLDAYNDIYNPAPAKRSGAEQE